MSVRRFTERWAPDQRLPPPAMPPAAQVQAATPDFSFAVSRAMGTVVVTAHGCWGPESAATLRAVLLDLVENQGNLSVVVDVHDLVIRDPSSMDTFAQVAIAAARRGGRLSTADPPECLRQALVGADLEDLIVVTRPSPPSPEALNVRERRRGLFHHPAGGPGDTRSS